MARGARAKGWAQHWPCRELRLSAQRRVVIVTAAPMELNHLSLEHRNIPRPRFAVRGADSKQSLTRVASASPKEKQ